MSKAKSFKVGWLTAEALNLALKEMIRRAGKQIESRRTNFVSTTKVAYDPGKIDFYTDADEAAQKTYSEHIHKSFPYFGIIAEEGGLRKKSKYNCKVTLTIDPLDGTKAFARLQPTVSTMLGVLYDGSAEGGYIFNPFTGDLFYTRLGSEKAHWVPRDETQHIDLSRFAGAKELKKGYVLLRDPIELYKTTLAKKLAKNRTARSRQHGLFKSSEMSSGSIGLSFARLWTGDVVALLLKTGTDTPWDLAPIVAICAKLGYQFYAIDDKNNLSVRKLSYYVPLEPTKRLYETLVIHESNVPELEAFLNSLA